MTQSDLFTARATPNGTRVYIAGEDCPHCGMHQTWDGERCLYPECPSRHVQLSEVRSQALKSHGMRFAAQTAGATLDRARNVAAQIAAEKGTVTADDVRETLGIPPGKQNGNNWMGSLFKDDRFVPTGQFVPARLSTSRGRMIRVWRLK